MTSRALFSILVPMLFHVGESGGRVRTAEATGGAGVQVRFSTEPAGVITGEPTVIGISVLDDKGARVREFTIVHEKPLHLFIVAADFREFAHVHPDRGPDGSFRIAHTFRRAGSYRLYAEVTPMSGPAGLGTHIIEVGGGASGTPDSGRPFVESRTSVQGGTRIELRSASELAAGAGARLQFLVTDATTGDVVQDLEPYLGAPVHVAVVGEDGEFLHAHAPGHGSEGGGAHSGHHAPVRAQGMEVEVTFPRSGFYGVWAQFQRAGRVITAPFVVEVSQ